MDDRFIKYTKLSIIIFLLFLAIPVTFSLVIGVFYGFSAIISSKPIDLIFEIFIISVPALLFSTVYAIFFKRTASHPSRIIKYISYFLFIAGIGISIFFLISDLWVYFKINDRNVTNYESYGKWYLAGNVAVIFLIGVMQAFSTTKEKDWMEKAKEKSIS